MAGVGSDDLHAVARQFELSLSENTSAAFVICVKGIAVSVRNRSNKTDETLSLTGII